MHKASESGLIDKIRAGGFVGVVEGLSNYDYHSFDKYWSSTQLKYLLSTSPVHFKMKYIDKTLRSKPASSDMILGSAVHSLLLDPTQFQSEFLVMPPLNLKTKSGREEKAKLIAKHSHKMVIDEKSLNTAQTMTSAVLKNERATQALSDTKKELSIFWKCSYSGLPFRAKLDGLSNSTLIELKTTSSAKKDDFERQCDNFNYDLSLWHYRLAVNSQPELKPVSQCVFVVVESDEPFLSEVYEAHDAMVSVGQVKWLRAVDQLSDGVNKNYWPGYVTERGVDDSVLMPPAWSLKKWVPNYGVEDRSGN